MNEDRKFCVYLYRRKNTDIVYYIGQGTLKRANAINEHNKFCKSDNRKYGTDIEIYKDNLTKEEALDLEEELIAKYVYELNYGIHIGGYYKKDGYNLDNCTFGKEGYAIMSGKLIIGKDNPAKRPDVREKLSKHAKENNSFALDDVRKRDSERMKAFSNTKEQKEIQSQRMKHFYETEEGKEFKKRYGEISKQYWKDHRDEMSQKLKDYFKTEKGIEQAKRQSERCKGQDAPNAKRILCIETNEI